MIILFVLIDGKLLFYLGKDTIKHVGRGLKVVSRLMSYLSRGKVYRIATIHNMTKIAEN